MRACVYARSGRLAYLCVSAYVHACVYACSGRLATCVLLLERVARPAVDELHERVHQPLLLPVRHPAGRRLRQTPVRRLGDATRAQQTPRRRPDGRQSPLHLVTVVGDAVSGPGAATPAERRRAHQLPDVTECRCDRLRRQRRRYEHSCTEPSNARDQPEIWLNVGYGATTTPFRKLKTLTYLYHYFNWIFKK